LQSLSDDLQPHVLSFLLSLALSDFSPVYTEFFLELDDVDEKVKGIEKTIKHAGAVKTLWDLVEESSDSTRYGLYKVLETLLSASHRNGGILSSLGIVSDVFRRLKEANDKEKYVLQKLLRKLLEMGASTAEARGLFQAALKGVDHDKLDPDILDVIRYGMKSRWVEHFSMEGEAAISLQGINVDSRWKTLPKDGMTFLVSNGLILTH
jgi:hypothetical protein